MRLREASPVGDQLVEGGRAYGFVSQRAEGGMAVVVSDHEEEIGFGHVGCLG